MKFGDGFLLINVTSFVRSYLCLYGDGAAHHRCHALYLRIFALDYGHKSHFLIYINYCIYLVKPYSIIILSGMD